MAIVEDLVKQYQTDKSPSERSGEGILCGWENIFSGICYICKEA